MNKNSRNYKKLVKIRTKNWIRAAYAIRKNVDDLPFDEFFKAWVRVLQKPDIPDLDLIV
jgi:hypothetical protein